MRLYAHMTIVVDRFAALLHARDVKAGDFVGVYTTNSPEMVITLYALSKLGAVAAMINTNLRGTPFEHDDLGTTALTVQRRHVHPLPQCLRLQIHYLDSGPVTACLR